MSGILAGDVLFYYNSKASLKQEVAAEAVKLGEILEDGLQKKEYYHCAIALSPTTKIEADGQKVSISGIIFDKNVETFDAYHLNVHPDLMFKSLDYIKTLEGQLYDWWFIADQGLRDLTGGEIHLPETFVHKEEIHKKICSTLVNVFALRAGLPKNEFYKELGSPEDSYLWINPQSDMVYSNV